MFDTKLKDGETEEQYIWRLGRAKDLGKIDLSWEDIAVLINQEFRDQDCQYTSSAYRKAYQQAKRFFEAGVFGNLSRDTYIQSLRDATRNLEKERVKLRDERTEYNRTLREQARHENFRSMLADAVEEGASKYALEYDQNKEFKGVLKSDSAMIISFTDVHAGLNIDNFFNKFDENELKNRINHYLDRIFEIWVRHGSDEAYVVLSELVNGIIHITTQLENDHNLMQQFLMISDLVAQFLAEISYRIPEVYVAMAPGNHSRITPKKDNAIRGENMDILVIPYLKAKLQNFHNIHFVDNTVDEYIAMFKVKGNIVVAVHGDKDTPQDVVQKCTMFLRFQPDIVWMGHRHLNAMSTVFDSKVIQSGCLSGNSMYAVDMKLRNRPEQVVAIVKEDGLDCFYDIKF